MYILAEITEQNLPHIIPNVDSVFKMFVWKFEEACDIQNCDSDQVSEHITIFKWCDFSKTT